MASKALVAALVLVPLGCAPQARPVGTEEVWPVMPPGPPPSDGAVTLDWGFPGLVETSTGATFPTYLAHLFGKHPQHALPLETVCLALKNDRAGPLRARLRVELPVFGQPASQDLTVAAGQATTACLDPAFDLQRLYALRDSTPGRLEASL